MRTDLKKSLRVWAVPFVASWLIIVLVLFLFMCLTKNVPRDSSMLDRLEEILVLVLGLLLLATAYIVAKRYEHINNTRISKRTILYGKVFLSVYLVYLAIIAVEWVGQMSKWLTR